MTLGLLIPTGEGINAVSTAQSRKVGGDRLEQSRSPLRLHWQRGTDGRLRCTWESVAKPPTDEDAVPDFRPASPNASLASMTCCLSPQTRRQGKGPPNRVPTECSNNAQTACTHRRLAA